ncbi:hypothetical protein ACIQWN_38520 [Streptomyces vinaceus]|uniref:hypothetical protein n=1 Tax=Streptomyces vinaceus TaxID=1960 RepID=UPI0037F47D19
MIWVINNSSHTLGLSGNGAVHNIAEISEKNISAGNRAYLKGVGSIFGGPANASFRVWVDGLDLGVNSSILAVDMKSDSTGDMTSSAIGTTPEVECNWQSADSSREIVIACRDRRNDFSQSTSFPVSEE